MPEFAFPTVVDFPSDLELSVTTEFSHPPEIVFDVHSKVEHVRKTFAPFDEQVTVCEIDLQVGGNYHYEMITPDGTECSFRGIFLEIDRPHKMKQTWIFDGWHGVEAIETMTFEPTPNGTKYCWNLHFANSSDRKYFAKTDGIESNIEVVRQYLQSLEI